MQETLDGIAELRRPSLPVGARHRQPRPAGAAAATTPGRRSRRARSTPTQVAPALDVGRARRRAPPPRSSTEGSAHLERQTPPGRPARGPRADRPAARRAAALPTAIDQGALFELARILRADLLDGGLVMTGDPARRSTRRSAGPAAPARSSAVRESTTGAARHRRPARRPRDRDHRLLRLRRRRQDDDGRRPGAARGRAGPAGLRAHDRPGPPARPVDGSHRARQHPRPVEGVDDAGGGTPRRDDARHEAHLRRGRRGARDAGEGAADPGQPVLRRAVQLVRGHAGVHGDGEARPAARRVGRRTTRALGPHRRRHPAVAFGARTSSTHPSGCRRCSTDASCGSWSRRRAARPGC